MKVQIPSQHRDDTLYRIRLKIHISYDEVLKGILLAHVWISRVH